MRHVIRDVSVHLVSMPVRAGLADSTRPLDRLGYVVVRLETDQGLEGFGITYNEEGGAAIKEVITGSMAPRLRGRDPFDTEVIWHELITPLRGVGRKGLVFGALSAVDIALWDLKGKIVGLPLRKLFGGGRTRVPVYASGGWTSYGDDELVAESLEMVNRGYATIKIKVGVAGGTAPRWDLERVRKVREAIGPDVGLLLDANNCWDAATAIRFANLVRVYDPLFLEEPVVADDIPGLARFRRGTDVPVATGEHEYTKFGLRDLVLHEAADVVQVDATRAGGFTEMLKCIAITQAWNVKFAPHAMDLVHHPLAASAPNALFLERLLVFDEVTAAVFPAAPVPNDGYLEFGDAPGLGFEPDRQVFLE